MDYKLLQGRHRGIFIFVSLKPCSVPGIKRGLVKLWPVSQGVNPPRAGKEFQRTFSLPSPREVRYLVELVGVVVVTLKFLVQHPVLLR